MRDEALEKAIQLVGQIFDRPRDPARIRKMLEALEVAWMAHPDLRLGQLISNLSHPQDMFYIEDEILMLSLTSLILKGRFDATESEPSPSNAVDQP